MRAKATGLVVRFMILFLFEGTSEEARYSLFTSELRQMNDNPPPGSIRWSWSSSARLQIASGVRPASPASSMLIIPTRLPQRGHQAFASLPRCFSTRTSELSKVISMVLVFNQLLPQSVSVKPSSGRLCSRLSSPEPVFQARPQTRANSALHAL